MSWASHNPEKYDEICKDGIADKIATILHNDGFDTFEFLTIGDVVDALYQNSKLASALVDWATDEINRSEADYWADRIDEAKMRKEEDHGNRVGSHTE